jgi:hypothetical protein
MEPEREQPTQAWLDELDAIVAGHDSPAAHDDELLQLTQRLASGLKPLQGLDEEAEQRRQHLLRRLRARPAQTMRRRVYRPRFALLVAALLVVVLVSGVFGAGRLWGTAGQVWNAATSLNQLQGISVASLSRPHAGLHPLPLLPTALPAGTQSAAYGVITDDHDRNLLKVFVADYRVAGQDVSLYEQPSGFFFISPSAQTVPIGGGLEGQVFWDTTGTHALQWYQDEMICQLTSTLPVEQLVALARLFQPIMNWDLIR